jgi:hypothetical protein
MKKAEKVEMKVMTTERSRFPPNITVQMLEAPPPGLHPTSQTKVKYGVRSPEFIWAPCHVMCTAVLIG